MHYHEPSDFKFVVEQRHAYPAGGVQATAISAPRSSTPPMR